MNFLQERLPLLALAAVFALILLWRERSSDAPKPGRAEGATLVAGLLAIAVGLGVSANASSYGLMGIGLGLGLLTASLAACMGGGAMGTALFAAVAAQAPFAFSGSASPVLASATVAAGLALGGWSCQRLAIAGPAALVALISGSVETLGVEQLGGVHGAPGAITTAAVGLAMLGLVVGKGQKWLLPASSIAIGGTLFLVGSRLFQYVEVGLVGLVAAVVAGLIAWALPSDEDEGIRPVVVLFGAILMVAVGTAAFAEARGLGMGFAALATLLVAVVSARPMLAALASPLAALAIYRGFGVAYPDAARALDIGQHYGLIGFLGGLLAALAVAELQGQTRHRSAVFGALAGVSACFAAPLLLGAKGSVGLLTGLGFAPAIALLLPSTRSFWGVSSLFMGATICGYAAWRDQMALTRSEKLPILAAVGGFALLCGVLAALTNRPTEEHPEGSV